MDFETSLRVLNILSDALTCPNTVDEALDRITQMTGVLMDTEHTVLLLRDEERRELIVRNGVGIDTDNIKLGHPLVVPERLKNILWKLRSLHQVNWVESGVDDSVFPILVVPLRIRGERIGLLITGKSRLANQGYDQIRRRLYVLIASFASLVIENAKVHDYLRQQFAQRSRELVEANRLESNSGDETRQLMISSLTNPNKVVRLLAESFYKELARAGFAAGHITTAASQILECITHDKSMQW